MRPRARKCPVPIDRLVSPLAAVEPDGIGNHMSVEKSSKKRSVPASLSVVSAVTRAVPAVP
ncbi:hypothetical protein MESS4_740014 [Mesorhizobium sp. STM 4661]|nr:hypothetical protein MESS4_740014 [Mesorhizobium sp. STM 4661]